MAFEVQASELDGVTVVSATGDLGEPDVPAFLAMIERVADIDARVVVLDLAAVQLVEATGLVLVLHAVDRFDAADRRCIVAVPIGRVRHLLELAAAPGMLELAVDRTTALTRACG